MTHSKIRFLVQPGGRLWGVLRVPGDKSISHRSVILGAIAEGVTQISGFLEGQDCVATIEALRAMGVSIEGPHDGRVVVHGVGKRGLKVPDVPIYLGNSGTSMRLLAGLLSGQSFDVVLTGDHSLTGRPMRRVTQPLMRMGAQIEAADGGTPPLIIKVSEGLRGIDYDMPVASAQVKSCLLLAGLYAGGRTCVREPAPTRDHTERMLTGFGYPVERQGRQICVTADARLTAASVDVPGDISSAAFFLVGASIREGSELLLEHVGINPTRTGVIEILKHMGANIEVINETTVGGEPVADIRVSASPLKGIDIPESLVSLAIDEFPAIFIAAACAKGRTVLRGAEELRVKESDRILVMAQGLQACGIKSTPTADGIVIEGGQIRGATVHSRGDHRIAMAFSMAGLCSETAIEIEDCDNVNTSFPGFPQLAKNAGLGITVRQ
ncbi:MAG: 3-phosphoshikimate 1-carboxyvinyltransferase [Gammaproteobacteria bacterium]|nr:3-phosphoshikimate 1-carboxyvinyltransferase [Gammaproteobacteria bacterium]